MECLGYGSCMTWFKSCRTYSPHVFGVLDVSKTCGFSEPVIISELSQMLFRAFAPFRAIFSSLKPEGVQGVAPRMQVTMKFSSMDVGIYPGGCYQKARGLSLAQKQKDKDPFGSMCLGFA